MLEKEFVKKYREEFAVKVAHISEKSAYNYVTYLRNACKLPGMKNHLTLIAESSNSSSLQIKYAEELCDAIDLAYDDSYCVISKKDLENSLSAAHMLLAYVSGQQWVKNKGAQVTFTQIFNRKSLYTTFKSRLRTQDRIYDYGAFPANLLSKLATKYGIRDFWDRLIAKTKFVYDKGGNFFYFESIDRVMLGTTGNAYLEKDGRVYVIFTKIAQTGIYKEVKNSTLKKLSLDHDYPVERALRVALNSNPMPEYKKLCKDILNFSKQYKQTYPRAKSPEIIGEYEKIYDPIRLQIDERVLLNEAMDFIDTLSLTIMDLSQNTAKSNRVNL